MSFNLQDFLTKIGEVTAPLIDNVTNSEKAKNTLIKAHALLQFALPVVTLVSQVTPTNVDNQVADVMGKIGIGIETILSQYPANIVKANKADVSTELLRKNLIEVVSSGREINIGDKTLKTVDDVLKLSESTLKAAVNLAYAVHKDQ